MAEAGQPTLSCLVNSYNYARYVEEAVDSALRQTLAFDEIIVVDDGSSDDSVSRLRARFGSAPGVSIVEKPNAGQLSCFNDGFARSRGDLVFFLDADDLYEPDYVSRAVAVYRAAPGCGFVFTGLRRFGARDEVASSWHRAGDLGRSAALALARGKFVGAPTSAVSARRAVLDRLLPLALEADWHTRADECLVLGCSLAGASKHHLDAPLVRYRVHGANQLFGKTLDADESAEFTRRRERMLGHLVERLGIDRDRLLAAAADEFRSIPRPHRRDLVQYLRVVAGSRASPPAMLAMAARMLGHHLGHHLSSARGRGSPPSCGESSR